MREGIICVLRGWPREANVNLLPDVHCREPITGYPEMKSPLCPSKRHEEFTIPGIGKMKKIKFQKMMAKRNRVSPKWKSLS
jgi:hypothetical protein